MPAVLTTTLNDTYVPLQDSNLRLLVEYKICWTDPKNNLS